MIEFIPSGFFVLRTPLLPVQDFLALSAGLSFFQKLHQDCELASSADADRKLVRQRIRKLAERPEVKAALWLASPDFCEALALWPENPESEKDTRLEHSLYRYVARMTSRPTPFGLFAGCSVGRIGPQTQLNIAARSTYYRRSRLDMEYLCNLAGKISADPGLHNHLCFRPNTSLYLAAGRHHHTQACLNDGQRAYRLVATDPSSFLTATLERAASGATPYDLATALVLDDPEISFEESQQYIRDLIDSQLLVADLNPPITGPEPMQDMLVQLEKLEDSSLKTKLECVSQRLRNLDQLGMGNDIKDYEEIISSVSSLPAEFKRDHLIQVDMMKPASRVFLDQRLIQSILQAVEVLHSLVPVAKDSPLEQFKKDFRDRYQEQEIPLLLALDEEVGIGFDREDGRESIPEPLIEGLDFASAGSRVFKATEAEFILLRKVQELAEEKKNLLELDSALLDSLRMKNPLPLPDAFAVLGSVVEPSVAPEEKFSFCLQNVTGPSGALLLGRFCHAHDELATWVQKHMRAEEAARASQNVVFAEIAHLPEGRIGNVLCRPHLRHYEIPFLASSRISNDRQIGAMDLIVSVKNDRVVLRSRRLQSEVVPRLTSAHNYTDARNLKLYKFLCLLQTQGVSGGLAWDWGIVDQSLFLPRVALKDVVLSPARWRLTKELIQTFAREGGIERLRKIDQWRAKMRVPRFVLLTESDNQLLIDLENITSVETLADYISKRDSARLVEMLPGPDRLCAHGPEGNFTNEVVIPFVRESRPVEPSAFGVKARSHPLTHTSATPFEDCRRTFLPGSEWLFAKIYASPSQVDHLLLKQVAPLVEKVIASGEAESWFFVRYADPEWHLRLRFRGDPSNLNARVLPQLSECLEREREQGRALRVQLDTYEREVERYGGPAGIRIAERLFQFDSQLALDLLGAISSQLGASIRWHLAFFSVDTLLAALGFDLKARRDLVDNLGKMQEKSFALDRSYKKQLSAKFRDQRLAVDGLLEPSPEDLPQVALDALRRFAGCVQTIRTELESLQQNGELSKTISELAGSYVHMHLNRMFRSAQNPQEIVLYDFLARTYESKLAREAGRRSNLSC